MATDLQRFAQPPFSLHASCIEQHVSTARVRWRCEHALTNLGKRVGLVKSLAARTDMPIQPALRRPDSSFIVALKPYSLNMGAGSVIAMLLEQAQCQII